MPNSTTNPDLIGNATEPASPALRDAESPESIERREVLAALEAGIEDMKAGRVETVDAVFDRLEKQYGF